MHLFIIVLRVRTTPEHAGVAVHMSGPPFGALTGSQSGLGFRAFGFRV